MVMSILTSPSLLPVLSIYSSLSPSFTISLYIIVINYSAFGDRNTYTKQVSDSDGLWTSQTALGQVYRYIVEHSRESRELAWSTFLGLERLSSLTPAYPKYAARSFCKLGEGTRGCPSSPQDAAQGWYNGTEEGWMYKSDTSSDEVCGFLAAFPMFYDHIASTAGKGIRPIVVTSNCGDDHCDGDDTNLCLCCIFFSTIRL